MTSRCFEGVRLSDHDRHAGARRSVRAPCAAASESNGAKSIQWHLRIERPKAMTADEQTNGREEIYLPVRAIPSTLTRTDCTVLYCTIWHPPLSLICLSWCCSCLISFPAVVIFPELGREDWFFHHYTVICVIYFFFSTVHII